MPIVGFILTEKATINFLCARTEAGSPLDVAIQSAEEMTTPGVDGRRWRTVNRQHSEYILTTVTECTNYADAITKRKSVEAMTNKIATLQINIGGQSLNFEDVHVNAVRGICVPGPVIAVGSTGGTAHLICEWSLVDTVFKTEAT